MDLKYLEHFSFEPIGFLESCYKDKFGVPRQPGLVKNSTALLRIRADLQPEQSLQGLEGFSHIWLIFVFHKNRTSRFHSKVHPPRLEGQKMGLFATRTPHRPNPIGLSLVELVSINRDSIEVRGIDLVDGTPIFDIKPYMPDVESRPDAKTGWTCGVTEKNINVDFTDEAQKSLDEWQSRSPHPNIREIIVDTLKLDPRPLVYKGFEEGLSPYRESHAFRLFDGDVHFKYQGPEKAIVFKILSMNN